MNVNYVKYLISLSQKGKKNSFIELCEMNLKPVYILVGRTLGDEKITNEVVKHVFLSAWQNIRFVRDDISITSWLRSIAVFEIMEELRNRASRKKVYAKPGSQIHNPIKTTNETEKQIQELPELERAVFVLHDIEGYSSHEISGFFDDVNPVEVRNILKIARQKLAEQIIL